MLADLQLPENVTLVRSTPIFGSATVPPGLLKEHQIGTDVWGVIRVESGSLDFTFDDSGESRSLGDGDHQVIPPQVLHHVKPGDDSRFHIDFYC